MAFWPALLLARSSRLPWALQGAAGGGRGAARRRRAAQPEPRLALRDAGDAGARVRAAARSAAHVRAARARWRGAIAASAPAVLARRRPPARRVPSCRAASHTAIVGDASRRRSRSGSWWLLGAALERGRRSRIGGAGAASARPSPRSRWWRSSWCWRAGSWPPATRSTRVRKRLAQLQGRLRVDDAGGQPARQRPGQQPLRLLPGGARRVPRPPAWRGSEPTTSSSSTSRTGAAARRPATRTASSCAPSPRRACSVRCWRWRGSAAALARGEPARCAAASRSPRAVAAAALGGFAYWVVHGSFDWFWEFAGLGAPAFAMLGLACSLGAAPEPARADPRRSPRRGRRRPRCWCPPRSARRASALALALAAPWLSQLEIAVRRAHLDAGRRASPTRAWTMPPSLNPLSDEAYLVAGSIALRYGAAGARRPRVRARAAAHPRRRLRDARARGDRLGAR